MNGFIFSFNARSSIKTDDLIDFFASWMDDLIDFFGLIKMQPFSSISILFWNTRLVGIICHRGFKNRYGQRIRKWTNY